MKFLRSVRVPDDVCRCATMHKNNGFMIKVTLDDEGMFWEIG